MTDPIALHCRILIAAIPLRCPHSPQSSSARNGWCEDLCGKHKRSKHRIPVRGVQHPTGTPWARNQLELYFNRRLLREFHGADSIYTSKILKDLRDSFSRTCSMLLPSASIFCPFLYVCFVGHHQPTCEFSRNAPGKALDANGRRGTVNAVNGSSASAAAVPRLCSPRHD